MSNSKPVPIKDGEQCPECGTDVSVAGNGCRVQEVESGELVEERRKCYTCGNEWVANHE